MTANNTLINILSNMEDDTAFTVQRGDDFVCFVYYNDGEYFVSDIDNVTLYTSDNVDEVSMFIENMEAQTNEM